MDTNPAERRGDRKNVGRRSAGPLSTSLVSGCREITDQKELIR
jgi:hypothetical protein